LETDAFKSWLAERCFRLRGKFAGDQAMRQAIQVWKGEARFGSSCKEVNVRVAGESQTIEIDLCDEQRHTVFVSQHGWSCKSVRSVYTFYRPPGLLALPEPVKGGSLNELWQLVNVPVVDRPLIAGWLLMCFRPRGPYPLLAIRGEQGSAKSCLARVLRSLVDPHKAPLPGPPRNEEDLVIRAMNGLVVAVENVSFVSRETADWYCRLLTGSGLSKRKLYSNFEEAVANVCRPMLWTAIKDLTKAPDLCDRSVSVALPPIERAARRREDELFACLEEARPRILGALLDGVVAALAEAPESCAKGFERLADFEAWARAGMKALGFDPDAFSARYQENRHRTATASLDASLTAAAIESFVTGMDCECWEGTSGQLLAELSSRMGYDPTRPPDGWPRHGQGLRNTLDEITPSLRLKGIHVSHRDQNGSKTKAQLTRIEVKPAS
jgi:hypothetical protein